MRARTSLQPRGSAMQTANDHAPRSYAASVARQLLGAMLALAPLACSAETHRLGDGRALDAALAIPLDAALAIQPEAAPERPAPLAFEPPTALTALGEDNDDPSLSEDLRELYFNSKREGGAGREDIWYATRATASAAWLAPEAARALNTSDRETGIALSPDGLTLWFSSDRPGGHGGLDVYVARRATRAEPFAQPTLVEELSQAGDDLVSAVDARGLTLYLARRDDEDDDYDLFVAERTSTSARFVATPLSSLNSARAESDAFAVAGALLFTRDGELSIARRASDGTYLAPSPFDALNSADDDRDVWASDDLSYLMFSSNRSGSYLLYESRLRDQEEKP